MSSGMFWVDLVGVFPFETVALLLTTAATTAALGDPTTTGGDQQVESTMMQLLSTLRLLSLVRLYRIGPWMDNLQNNPRISLIGFTLARNFAVLLFANHLSACVMYFLARINEFSVNTWLPEPIVLQMNDLQRYVVALYQSVVTFSTVGYGDFAPANEAEQIWGMMFMLTNVVLQSWVFGSITLLILKSDEKTGQYRDALETLDQYSSIHQFDDELQKNLKKQLRLDFTNREVSDEQVLKNFPASVRRKILRKLYLPALMKTSLMQNVRQQFVDTFLTSCSVETFSPGEEIVERGSIAADLFLIITGTARVVEGDGPSSSSSSSSMDQRRLGGGEFIGEIAFFTDSPQPDSVGCLTVCKTLTITREKYTELCLGHPGSAGQILQNLLSKVEDIAKSDSKQKTENIAAVKDRIQVYARKQKDDQTTRFLFAASRGDNNLVTRLCDQGFDPNSADYDSRTALMVASMKGNTDTVQILLNYKADPSLVDFHGSTALYEAVKNGNEATADLLLQHGAKLCMDESLAASILCQAVYDGDIVLLRRLLRAQIQVNASDYDKRTAAHIAAAEGNLAALKVLIEHNADMTRRDRWEMTAIDEAKRVKAVQVLDFVENLKKRNGDAK